MADYWKSTDKYWCRYCSQYVRDTPLERRNHEATGRHQGAVKRHLRNLHRDHEREEREKERAKQEVERLNRIVGGVPSTATPTAEGNARSGGWKKKSTTSVTSANATPLGESAQDRQRQMEQLHQMGVAVPEDARRDMALPGEWTVTATQEIDPEKERQKQPGGLGFTTGVRKRDMTEEDKEAEQAVKQLWKKPKRWGRDSKKLDTGSGDGELDALLTGLAAPGLGAPMDKDLQQQGIKRERPEEMKLEDINQEIKEEIKEEEIKAEDTTPDTPPGHVNPRNEDNQVKQEDTDEGVNGKDKEEIHPTLQYIPDYSSSNTRDIAPTDDDNKHITNRDSTIQDITHEDMNAPLKIPLFKKRKPKATRTK